MSLRPKPQHTPPKKTRALYLFLAGIILCALALFALFGMFALRNPARAPKMPSTSSMPFASNASSELPPAVLETLSNPDISSLPTLADAIPNAPIKPPEQPAVDAPDPLDAVYERTQYLEPVALPSQPAPSDINTLDIPQTPEEHAALAQLEADEDEVRKNVNTVKNYISATIPSAADASINHQAIETLPLQTVDVPQDTP